MTSRRGIVIATLALATTARADGTIEVTRPVDPPPPAALLGGADAIDGEELDGYVSFTFDDGPKTSTTPAVMDALIAYDVPGTFFVVGNRLVGKRHQEERDLIVRMVELGFEVGNHTYRHPHLKALGDKQMVWQIDRTSRVVEKLTGKPMELFRPPYGSASKHSEAHTAKVGLTSVLWNIDSSDWRRPKADRMRKAIGDAIRDKGGGVVLMHDTKKLTAQTITGILDDLEAANCARLAAAEPIITPVSLHYFAEDDGVARPIPPEVEARTQRYRDGLPARCKAR